MKKILFALFFLLTVVACSQNADIKELKSGLKYSTDKPGEGGEAVNGNLVTIHFKGWIIKDSSDIFSDWSQDTTKNMDIIGDTYSMGQPAKFVLGTESFIKGSDEGIVGMKKGEVRTIVIPSMLAYGQQGIGPVPPNSNFKLVVELLEVKEVQPVVMWDVDSTKFKTTESGLKYAIIEEGEGDLIAQGKQASVHYSGFLMDGTKFDSSVERDEPFTLFVGMGQVIKGWDEGLQLLKKGSKAKFIIPPGLGYGDRAVGPIPPNSTLIFDVEILDVK